MTKTTNNKTLLYFAWVREKVGHPEETVDLPDTVNTVADLLVWLKRKGPNYQHALEHENVIRVAVDQIHANAQTNIADAKEIAFFPPVTGG